jgi:SAM-dependent methyltransferase
MSVNDHGKSKWNNRYSSGVTGSNIPESFLIDHVSMLKPGSVYDIACGTGRNSIFLAQNGFEVFSIDISDVALTGLKEFSKKSNLDIKTIELDLNLKSGFNNLSKVNNIVAVHYKIPDDFLNIIPSLLRENGIFLYYTFNLKHSEARDFRKEFCLKPNELVKKNWKLNLLKYLSFQNEKGYFDGYLFQK